MADQCIGKLKLDITDVEQKITKINEALSKVGSKVNVNLSKEISKEVKAQLDAVLKEVEGYQKKIAEAADKAAKNASKGVKAKAKSEDNKELKEAIKLWNEYYNVLTKAENRISKGDVAGGMSLRNEAEQIRTRAAALREEEKVLDRTAAARKRYEDSYRSSGLRDRLKTEEAGLKAIEASQKRVNELAKERRKAGQDAEKSAVKKEEQDLKALIELYKQYYALDAKKMQAVGNGEIGKADQYRARATEIWNEIAAIEAENTKLAELAGSSREVAQAFKEWNTAAAAAQDKSDATFDKVNAQNIKAYADALTTLYNEQAKLNNSLATGKIKEGSEEYAAAQKRLQGLERAATEAGTKLDAAGIKMANSMQTVKTAVDGLAQSEAKLNDSSQVSALSRMEAAYRQLTTAMKNYNTAQKNKDNESKAYWNNQIDTAMQTVSAIEQEVNTLNVDADTRNQILTLINQCKTAQAAFNREQQGGAKGAGEMASQVKNMVARYLSLAAVIRTINSLIKNAVEYVSQFNDQMNEIQMISNKSDSEIARMAESYRSLAKEMSVTSTDIADAAIYFTRQGLGTEEIETRLKNTTQYAKAANLEFETAAELITSVVNSMGLVEQEAEDGRNAAQRVADVFLAVGDSAATSGQEIGEAMQKAGAAAGAFGMDFEWLAAYIATVSETTRQEATSIGTAFNTLIARLHSIRTTGFNAEDETKINDIQKALANLDIALLDSEGNWRDMTDIFNEIAVQWDTLDGKTKSYIATTMAGVKQQNVFLALMEDLSKQTEGNSRAFELYNIAMDSAGTASEKYAVYLDSVTAAQERMNEAQNRFYSLLSADTIKGYYDTMTGLIDGITSGTQALGGMNIILPVAAAGIGLLVAGMIKLSAAITAAGGAMAFFTTVVKANPVIALITGVTVAIGLLTGLGAAIETPAEKIEQLNKAINESQEKTSGYVSMQQELGEMFGELKEDGSNTNEVLSDHSELLEKLSTLSPTAKDAVDKLSGSYSEQTSSIHALNEEMEKLIQNEQTIQANALLSKYDKREETDADRLAGIIMRNGLDISNDKNAEDFVYSLPGDMYGTFTKIQDKKNIFQKNGFGDTESWGMAVRGFLAELFGGTDAQGYMTNQANEMIGEFIDIVSLTMSKEDTSMIRAQLAGLIFGEDGQLDASEYGDITNKLSAFLSTLIANGFEAAASVDGNTVIQSIGRDLFGDYFDILFGEQLANMPNKDDYAEGIATAIAELYEAGFTDSNIATLLRDKDLIDWEQAANFMKEQLKDGLKGKFGVKELAEIMEEEDLDTGEVIKTMVGYWDDLDLSTLQLIGNLADVGVQLTDINALMADSENMEEFVASLQSLGKEKGLEEDAEDVKTMAEALKDLKNAASDISTIDDMIKSIREKGMQSVKLSDILGLAESHPEILTAIQDAESLTEALQNVRSKITDQQKTTLKDLYLDNEDIFKGSDFAKTELATTSGAKSLRDYRQALIDAGASTEEVDQFIDSLAEEFIKLGVSIEEANAAQETWLQTQSKSIQSEQANNWAKNNGYAQQLAELNQPDTMTFEDGSVVDAFESMQAKLQYVMETWNAYDETMRNGIKGTFPEVVTAMAEVEAALADMNNESISAEDKTERLTKANEGLTEALQKAQKYNNTKNFKGTAKAIKDLEEGTISAADAYEAYYKECDKVTKAYDEVGKAQTKLDKGTALAESDVNALADALGVSADTIINDFPGALSMLEELRNAGEAAYNELNKQATMKILGVSEADFSNIMNGMVAVQDTASATIQMLLGLGQFKLEEREVKEGAQYPIINSDGSISYVTATTTGKYQFLVPTGNNALKPSGGGSSTANSSGGGGGGGGGGKDDAAKTIKQNYDRRLEPLTHAINMAQKAEDGFLRNNNYSSYMNALATELDATKEYAEGLRDAIADIKVEMGKAAAESDEWYALRKQLYEYEEQLEDIAAKYDEIADKRINALFKKHDEQDKSLTHAANLNATASERYLLLEQYDKYRANRDAEIVNMKATYNQNSEQLGELYTELTRLQEGTDNWIKVRDQIWALEEEQAQSEVEIMQNLIDIQEEALNEIETRLTRQNAPIEHRRNMLGTYAQIARTNEDWNNYYGYNRQTIALNDAQIKNNEAAINDMLYKLAHEIYDDAYQTRDDYINAIYQKQEENAQLTQEKQSVQMELNASLLEQINTELDDESRKRRHLVDMLGTVAEMYKDAEEWDNYRISLEALNNRTKEQVAMDKEAAEALDPLIDYYRKMGDNENLRKAEEQQNELYESALNGTKEITDRNKEIQRSWITQIETIVSRLKMIPDTLESIMSVEATLAQRRQDYAAYREATEAEIHASEKSSKVLIAESEALMERLEQTDDKTIREEIKAQLAKIAQELEQDRSTRDAKQREMLKSYITETETARQKAQANPNYYNSLMQPWLNRSGNGYGTQQRYQELLKRQIKNQEEINTATINARNKLMADLAKFKEGTPEYDAAVAKIRELEVAAENGASALMDLTDSLNNSHLKEILEQLAETTRVAQANSNIAGGYISGYEQIGDWDSARAAMGIKLEQDAKRLEETEGTIATLLQELTREGITAAEYNSIIDELTGQYQTLGSLRINDRENRVAINDSYATQVMEEYQKRKDNAERGVSTAQSIMDFAERYGTEEQQIQARQRYKDAVQASIAVDKEYLDIFKETLATMYSGTPGYEALTEKIYELADASVTAGMDLRELDKNMGIDRVNGFLETVERELQVMDSNLSMLGEWTSYYQGDGQFTNANTLIAQENELREQYNVKLKESIELLKTYIEEMIQLGQITPGSDEYWNLIGTLISWTEKVNSNSVAIQNNTRKIHDNTNEILKAKKELDDFVHEEYKNQVEIQKDMLAGTVSLQNLIIDTLRERYKEEAALVEKNLEKQKEALNQEKSLLAKRLQMRKDAIDQQDKYEELSRLKAQLAAISTDTSRSKEAKSLQAQIRALERENAMSIADAELNAETQRIDNEVNAIDDKIALDREKLDAYLEDANNFAGVVQELLSGTYDDLANWLSENNKQYRNSLDEGRQQMLDSWQDTWNQMKHIIVTYWDEVSGYLNNFDSYMQFMKGSDEYKSASANGKRALEAEYAEKWDVRSRALAGGASFSPAGYGDLTYKPTISEEAARDVAEKLGLDPDALIAGLTSKGLLGMPGMDLVPESLKKRPTEVGQINPWIKDNLKITKDNIVDTIGSIETNEKIFREALLKGDEETQKALKSRVQTTLDEMLTSVDGQLDAVERMTEIVRQTGDKEAMARLDQLRTGLQDYRQLLSDAYTNIDTNLEGAIDVMFDNSSQYFTDQLASFDAFSTSIQNASAALGEEEQKKLGEALGDYGTKVGNMGTIVVDTAGDISEGIVNVEKETLAAINKILEAITGIKSNSDSTKESLIDHARHVLKATDYYGDLSAKTILRTEETVGAAKILLDNSLDRVERYILNNMIPDVHNMATLSSGHVGWMATSTVESMGRIESAISAYLAAEAAAAQAGNTGYVDSTMPETGAYADPNDVHSGLSVEEEMQEDLMPPISHGDSGALKETEPVGGTGDGGTPGGTGQGGKGGGGGGGKKVEHGYTLTVDGHKMQNTGYKSKDEAYNGARGAIDHYFNGAPYTGETLAKKRQAAMNTIKAYNHGGLVDYTGLAMVHGSPKKPESFLSAIDTRNMRDLLNALNLIRISPMGGVNTDALKGAAAAGYGDINITINQAELKDDADFEDVAKRISKAFAKQLSKKGINLTKINL